MEKLHKSAKVVQEKLNQLGYKNEVKQLPESTRTAKEAADAIGCEVSQIAKSIIFKLKKSDQPLLVIASGINRINEKQVETHLDEKLGKADADFVSKHTGYIIGGVPPLGHTQPIKTFIDKDLLNFKDIWAAAGHPKSVFNLSPDELVEMTGGELIDIK